MIIRGVRPGEMDAVGELRVAAYQAQNHLAVKPDYADTLRVLGADGGGKVLVAVEDGRTAPMLGTVMVERWHAASEVARGEDEGEIRALAVAPQAQGRGVGRALVRAAIDQAVAWGMRQLVLSTQPAMTAAQRLYLAEGFVRLPERDWAPAPGVTLLAFGRPLAGQK
ncbi:N-acetyltransferase [Actinomadura sp. NBRC 104425]|uniref:GNAT family N-acetyltransferase n=1 Tax=Actinomadura sp. NBRC 104425 TaxID=3032204 RepID=UPI0024A1E957|nr:GNAT family N-acetyltransferase [Actinomadura sp. NBRC 104425]GLZ11598.1 N-acetyltransferase [Actinomadura sp. NBRC 104425]